jgi:hypothetical protein
MEEREHALMEDERREEAGEERFRVCHGRELYRNGLA